VTALHAVGHWFKSSIAHIQVRKMLRVRCKQCGKELTGRGSKPVSCGCPNMTTVKGDKISANDLSHVLMIDNGQEKQTKLSSSDMEWQESRRKRKIRRLDFDIR
tara:strand:- start:44 stop:355 length:312 start_codon:yes stop_codon:yes gene_type:complete